jgi:hypothetical protein
VSAKPHDWRLIKPLTWKWRVNGQLVATTSVAQTTLQAGDPWSEQDIEVVASDGFGNSATGTMTIQTVSGCPGEEIEC